MQPTGLHDLPEEELWTGGYSSKAMTGAFIGAAILSIAAFVAGSFFPPIGWMVAGGFVVLLFLYLGVVLLFRRMSVSYRLTSQRLIIERGVLGRTNDRVLVVEIDDLSVKQGAFERMFDVGSIVLDTKDKNTLDGTTPNSANVGGEGVLTMKGIENPSHVADLIDEARHAERARRGLYTVNS
jgi:membrane protein YdbS with pleckstrin-like domain